MKKFVMITIPHARQRYNTVGDYQDAHGLTLFTVSEMGNAQYEQLVALHELVEKILVDAAGISNAAIDDFDMAYEARRADGDQSEPGDHPDAPYYRQHLLASLVERMVAEAMGVDWEAYDATVVNL